MTNKRASEWVSASDIGRAQYCPHYLELKQKGAFPSEAAKRAMAKGEAEHEAFNRNAEDTRCFIASYVYGEFHPTTVMLRQYRNHILLRNSCGKLLVGFYYATSPFVVFACRRCKPLDMVCRKALEIAVRLIETQG